MKKKEETQKIGKSSFIRTTLLIFIFCMIIFQPQDSSSFYHEFPVIGKEIPDFTLDSISNYKKANETKSTLKGQYYILEFWTSSCGACINSFPKVNEKQKKYRSELQIFLIGYPDRNIRKLYETLRLKHSLDLSAAFDVDVFNQFVHSGTPLLIWIDKNAVVQAITAGSDLNEKNIDAFLSGQRFKFDDYSYEGLRNRSKVYDPSLPFLVYGNGGNDNNFIFRSTLTKWEKGMPFNYPGDIEDIRAGYYNPGGYATLKITLTSLYNLAFFGRYFPDSDSIFYYPILQLKDSSDFKPKGIEGDDNLQYSYSLTVPPEKYNKEELKKGIRKDLEYYFGYNAKIEKRAMPCYVIRVRDSSKLTKLKARISVSHNSKFIDVIYDNIEMQHLARGIAGRLLSHAKVYDETGINYKVSLKIDGLNSDPDVVRKGLQKYGLDLVKSSKMMEVLVISD